MRDFLAAKKGFIMFNDVSWNFHFCCAILCFGNTLFYCVNFVQLRCHPNLSGPRSSGLTSQDHFHEKSMKTNVIETSNHIIFPSPLAIWCSHLYPRSLPFLLSSTCLSCVFVRLSLRLSGVRNLARQTAKLHTIQVCFVLQYVHSAFRCTLCFPCA